MRQGQQNRRGRGRGRKPQNPLARNFESNGPDVKIRGTAAHIAEKYMSLARDALASGDIIAAESYLQHAEHYNRIIMAAQQQMGPPGAHQGDGPNGGFRSRFNQDGGDADETAEAEGAETGGMDPRGQRDMRHGGDGHRHGGDGHDRGRQGNGSDAVHDSNGSDQGETHQPDETAPDQVS